jgi:hypothetical protein
LIKLFRIFFIAEFFILSSFVALAAEPVSVINVVLKSKNSSQQFTVKTDNSGLAVFKDIPGGNYSAIIIQGGIKSFLTSAFKNNKNVAVQKDEQVKFEVTFSSEGLKDRQIRKNYSVNVRNTASGNQITGLDDWESPIALNNLLGTGGEKGGLLGGLKYTFEVRIQRN